MSIAAVLRDALSLPSVPDRSLPFSASSPVSVKQGMTRAEVANALFYGFSSIGMGVVRIFLSRFDDETLEAVRGVLRVMTGRCELYVTVKDSDQAIPWHAIPQPFRIAQNLPLPPPSYAAPTTLWATGGGRSEYVEQWRRRVRAGEGELELSHRGREWSEEEVSLLSLCSSLMVSSALPPCRALLPSVHTLIMVTDKLHGGVDELVALCPSLRTFSLSTYETNKERRQHHLPALPEGVEDLMVNIMYGDNCAALTHTLTHLPRLKRVTIQWGGDADCTDAVNALFSPHIALEEAFLKHIPAYIPTHRVSFASLRRLRLHLMETATVGMRNIIMSLREAHHLASFEFEAHVHRGRERKKENQALWLEAMDAMPSSLTFLQLSMWFKPRRHGYDVLRRRAPRLQTLKVFSNHHEEDEAVLASFPHLFQYKCYAPGQGEARVNALRRAHYVDFARWQRVRMDLERVRRARACGGREVAPSAAEALPWHLASVGRTVDAFVGGAAFKEGVVFT